MYVKTAAAVGLVLALGVAGCGGGHGDRVASANGSDKPSSSAKAGADDGREQALKFAQCMRDHGINMPDPKFNGKGGVNITVPDGTDPHRAEAAQAQCKQYLPNGGEPQKPNPQALAVGRKLAKCMRANGVPKFPDPGPNGGISIKGGPGLDPNDPTFKAAEKKCQPAGGGGSVTNQDGGGE